MYTGCGKTYEHQVDRNTQCCEDPDTDCGSISLIINDNLKICDLLDGATLYTCDQGTAGNHYTYTRMIDRNNQCSENDQTTGSAGPSSKWSTTEPELCWSCPPGTSTSTINSDACTYTVTVSPTSLTIPTITIANNTHTPTITITGIIPRNISDSLSNTTYATITVYHTVTSHTELIFANKSVVGFNINETAVFI